MVEQLSVSSFRKRRNSKQIQDLLKVFAKGDVTVQQFCSTYNISKGTFHKWQSRYKIKTTKLDVPGSFARIQINPSAVQAPLFAEVNGIKIYQPVAAAYLKELCAL